MAVKSRHPVSLEALLSSSSTAVSSEPVDKPLDAVQLSAGMNSIVNLSRAALLALLGLGAVQSFAQPQSPSPGNTDVSQELWAWVSRSGAAQWGHDRYINTESIRRGGHYVKYQLAVEGVLVKGAPELREVTLDCKARTRVENGSTENFRDEDMKAFLPKSIFGDEAKLACSRAPGEIRVN